MSCVALENSLPLSKTQIPPLEIEGGYQMPEITKAHLRHLLKCKFGISLVVQWLRIRLPMQGTRVRSLVKELRSHMLWGN